MRHPTTLVSASLLLLTPACMMEWDDWGDYDYMAESTEQITIPAAEVMAVAVSTHNGSVRLGGSPDARELRIDIRKQARGPSQEDADLNLRAMDVTHEVQDGRLELSWDWAEGRRGPRSGSVAFTIDAPPGLPVSIESHNGQVTVEGWQGDLVAETYNGSMDIDGDFEDVELVTYNGEIVARLEGSGPVNGRIETHNGAVDVRVSKDLSATVVASTDNGGVQYYGEMSRVEAGRNFLVGEVGSGDGRLRIRTHNGSVSVR